MFKISQGVHFVVDGDRVLVRRKESLSRLAGPDVRQILIPLLPELEQGLSIEKSLTLSGSSIQKVQEVLGKLSEIGYLTRCDKDENADNVKMDSREIEDISTLGVMGSDSLYRELVATLSYSSQWRVKQLEVEQLDGAENCEVVVFVNKGIDDAHTLSVARLLHSAGIKYLNVSFSDNNLQIGPYVQKGTACLQCCNSRRLANLTFAYEANIFSTAEKIYAAECSHDLNPEEVKFLTGIISRQCASILRFDGFFQSPFQERVITFNLTSMQITTEEFFRNPRCPICGHNIHTVSEVKQWSRKQFSKGFNYDN